MGFIDLGSARPAHRRRLATRRPGAPHRVQSHFPRGERAGCLTFVIDEQNGVNVPTRFALSASTSLDTAIADLRTAERISNKDRIGYVNLVRNTEREYARQQHPAACDTIKAWAQAKQLDAVVWTALPSNFEAEAKQPFSVEAAIQYLKALSEPAKSHALEYLQKAAPEVVTPVRTAAIQAGLIAPIASENQPEAEDAGSADDADGDEDQYPWEDVDKARHNQRLQRKHPPGEADKYRATAKPCPKCRKASADLAWFYFESPKWTLENLCGRAGWMTVCDTCRVQVDFFLEVLN